MKMDYQIGDECWIFAGDHDDETGTPRLSKGVVVATANIPHLLCRQFMIQLSDPDFIHLKVRDAYSMAENEDTMPAVAKLADPVSEVLPLGEH